MAVGRSAASKLDWTKVSSSLGLKGQTAAALLAFKKRNDDARRKLNLLAAQPAEVNFAEYRSKLKNTAVIDDIEGHFKTFKPVKYDLDRQLKSIEAFEVQAVKSAEATKQGVDEELNTLGRTLKNIEEARSFDDLTVDDVAAAAPEIDIWTERLVSKGIWMPPGYQEKFGNLSVL